MGTICKNIDSIILQIEIISGWSFAFTKSSLYISSLFLKLALLDFALDYTDISCRSCLATICPQSFENYYKAKSGSRFLTFVVGWILWSSEDGYCWSRKWQKWSGVGAARLEPRLEKKKLAWKMQKPGILKLKTNLGTIFSVPSQKLGP